MCANAVVWGKYCYNPYFTGKDNKVKKVKQNAQVYIAGKWWRKIQTQIFWFKNSGVDCYIMLSCIPELIAGIHAHKKINIENKCFKYTCPLDLHKL